MFKVVIYFSVVIKEEFGPVILAHVFILIGVYGAGIQLGKTIVIAIQHIDIDGEGIVAFPDGIGGADLFQTLVHSRDQRLEITLLLFIVGLVLKQGGCNLACCAGTPMAVYQIGENLFGPAALEVYRLPVRRETVSRLSGYHSAYSISRWRSWR